MLPAFLAPAAAWLFLLAVPLIVFYFLKLKRTRMEVPSLFLWRQVLRDQRVNSPFQRFKRNLLLLIQLALLASICLAAMQPFLSGRSDRIRRLPVLVDASASMGGLDGPGGKTRLEEAKARVRRIIDGLPSGQELAIVSFAKAARRRIGFSDDKRALREALDLIEVEDVASDLEDALRMAQALGRTAAFDEVLLLSDGNVPARTPFELSFAIQYQRIPRSGTNLGITALAAKRAGERWDLLALVEGTPEDESLGEILVSEGGRALARERVSAGKGKSQRVSFRVPAARASFLEVRIVPDGFDALRADDAAWIDLPAARALRVFCPPSLSTWRQALRSMPGVRVYPGEGDEKPAEPYDLVVTDRESDMAEGAAVSFSTGFVPAALRGVVRVESGPCDVVDWRRDALLLRHVEMSGLVIHGTPSLLPGVSEVELGNRGFEVLAQGPRGPLLLSRRDGMRTTLHALFHTDRSTLPYRVAFPILVSNLVRLSMEEALLAEARGVPTGILPPTQVPAGKACRIEGPEGIVRTGTADERGILAGIPAPRAGVYRISSAGGAPSPVGASLLSAAETTCPTVERIEFDERLAVAADASSARTDRALWRFLAATAFLLLLFEWWFFQRMPAQAGGGGRS